MWVRSPKFNILPKMKGKSYLRFDRREDRTG